MTKRIGELQTEVDRLEQAVAHAMTSVGTALDDLWPKVVVRRLDTIITAGTETATNLAKPNGFFPH